MKKNDVHIFVWRATPVIQCARRFFHSYLKETKKNQQSILKCYFESCVSEISSPFELKVKGCIAF